jgi:hypothetical protein
VRTLQLQRLEEPAPLDVGQVDRLPALELEHVEDDVGQSDARIAIEHPRADEREVRPTLIAERDELAVQDCVNG